jgi:hypothetical protein
MIIMTYEYKIMRMIVTPVIAKIKENRTWPRLQYVPQWQVVKRRGRCSGVGRYSRRSDMYHFHYCQRNNPGEPIRDPTIQRAPQRKPSPWSPYENLQGLVLGGPRCLAHQATHFVCSGSLL